MTVRTKTYLMVLGVTLVGAIACFILLLQIQKLEDDSQVVANLPFRKKEFKAPPMNENESVINLTFSLKVGQSYPLNPPNGSIFKLISVNDSRCPTDPGIACVWAGTVTAKIEILLNKTSVGVKEVELNKPSKLGNYTLNFFEVVPNIKKVDAQMSEYLLKFKINN